MKYLPIQLARNEIPQKTEVQALSFRGTSFSINQDTCRPVVQISWIVNVVELMAMT
jgi:hypothetical protein